MSVDPASPAALGLEPTYSAREASAMLGRSYGWLDQNLRSGQFTRSDGSPVRPQRTPGGYRRFTLEMLRDIVKASAQRGWFSTDEIRSALYKVIAARHAETNGHLPHAR